MSKAKRYYPESDYRIRFIGQDGKPRERTFCCSSNDLKAAMKYATADFKPKKIIALEALNGHIIDPYYEEEMDEIYAYPTSKKGVYPETVFQVFATVQRSENWLKFAPWIDGKPVLKEEDSVRIFDVTFKNRNEAYSWFKELRKSSPLATPDNLRAYTDLLSVAMVELKADTLTLHHWIDSFYCYGDSLLIMSNPDYTYYLQSHEHESLLEELAYS